MDENIEQMLKENLAISKENNELLKKLVNHQKWAQIYRFVYWGLIIAVSFGSFYFLQPYIGSIMNLYTGGVSNVNTFQDISKSLDSEKLKDFIKDLNQ